MNAATSRSWARMLTSMMCIFALIVSSCASVPSPGAASTSDSAEAITISGSCVNVQGPEQFRAMRSSAYTVVVGQLSPTGRVERIRSASGTTVAGEYRLTVAKLLYGNQPKDAAVWVEGGTADSTTVTMSDPTVFASADGKGLFTLSDQAIPERIAVLDGYPIIGNSLIVGLGCSQSSGLPSAGAPVFPRDLRVVTGGAMEQTNTEPSLARVPLSIVEQYFEQ